MLCRDVHERRWIRPRACSCRGCSCRCRGRHRGLHHRCLRLRRGPRHRRCRLRPGQRKLHRWRRRRGQPRWRRWRLVMLRRRLRRWRRWRRVMLRRARLRRRPVRCAGLPPCCPHRPGKAGGANPQSSSNWDVRAGAGAAAAVGVLVSCLPACCTVAMTHVEGRHGLSRARDATITTLLAKTASTADVSAIKHAKTRWPSRQNRRSDT
jgi:hypothetical protein